MSCFNEGLRLWEAHLYVFYESGRLSGGSGSNDAKAPGGSAKEKTLAGGGGGGWGGGGEARSVVFCKGLRFWEARFVFVLQGSEALGGSFVRVLRAG